MKLKNKLIPLTTIIASSAIVMPLVTLTSCKNEAAMTEYDFLDAETLPEPIIREESVNHTRYTAGKEYYDLNVNDSSIFKTDLIIYKYLNRIVTEKQIRSVVSKLEWTNYKVRISNPVFGKTKIAYPGTETADTLPTVSFTLVTELSCNIEQGDSTQGEINETITQNFVNVPFIVSGSEMKQNWNDSRNQLAQSWIDSGWRVGIPYGTDSWEWIFCFMPDAWQIDYSVSADMTTWKKDAKEEGKTTQKYNINNTYKTYADLLNVEKSGGASYFTSIGLSDIFFNFTSTYLSLCGFESEFVSAKNPVITAQSPWGTITTVANPTVKVVLFQLTDDEPSEEDRKNWVLDSNIDAPFLYTSADPERSETFKVNNYHIVADKGTELTIDEDGVVSFEATLKTDLTPITGGNALETTDAGEILYFQLPTQIAIRNSKWEESEQPIIAYPNDQIVKLDVMGTMELSEAKAISEDANWDKTAKTWDGTATIRFTYDIETRNPDDFVIQFNELVGHIAKVDDVIDEQLVYVKEATSSQSIAQALDDDGNPIDGTWDATIQFVGGDGNPITVKKLAGSTETLSFKIDFVQTSETETMTDDVDPHFYIRDIETANQLSEQLFTISLADAKLTINIPKAA